MGVWVKTRNVQKQKLCNSINEPSLLLCWNIKFSSLVALKMAVDMLAQQTRLIRQAKNNMIQHDEISFAFAFTVHQRLKIWFFNLLLFFFVAVPFAVHFGSLHKYSIRNVSTKRIQINSAHHPYSFGIRASPLLNSHCSFTYSAPWLIVPEPFSQF